MDIKQVYLEMSEKYRQLLQSVNSLSEGYEKVDKLNLRVEQVETKASKMTEKIITLEETAKSVNDKNASEIERIVELQDDKSKLVYRKLTKRNELIQRNIESMNEKLETLDVEYNSIKNVINLRTESMKEYQTPSTESQRINPTTEFIKVPSCMCNECVVPYKRKELISKVTRGGINDKAFSCNICGERFNVKWLLKTHIEQHTQQKQYPCSKCGKAFVLEWRLQKHMLMHTEDKKIRSCHFFNNGKSCPFEEIGCKFLHKEAPMCKYATRCKYDKCQFRHK